MTEYLQKELEQRKQTIEMAAGDKYNHSGIYSIFINNNLVYIGQSKSMIDRIATHMYEIDVNEKTNKYIQLRRAREHGQKIRFDVMTYCEPEELDQKEGELIRKYRPPLNYQIPKAMGGYRVNKIAKLITYESILGLN